ncbi:SRPBCC domain-containing protein [Kribbella soli]|jgi:uncharacterized protein YndB with AHSA1/START domain
MLGCEAERLWKLITRPENLSRWLGPTVMSDTQYGGFVVVTPARTEQTGSVTTCEPPHYFQAALDQPPHRASTVLVDVVPGRGGAHLILTHAGIHDTLLAKYDKLWTAALDRLRQLVEGQMLPKLSPMEP